MVIVTGASSGIGAATARMLYAVGARPVLAARRADRIDRLAKELGGALAVRTDVTVPAELQHLTQRTVDRYGQIDGLVNNAGAGDFYRLDEITPAAFLQLLNLNVVSVVAAIQAVLPHMKEIGHGSIVNVSSGSTHLAVAGNAIYPATKAAMNWLSEVGRMELEAENIRLSLVLPRITATEFFDGSNHGGRPAGVTAHSPEYVSQYILRALRSGEARIDIPEGPEQLTPSVLCDSEMNSV